MGEELVQEKSKSAKLSEELDSAKAEREISKCEEQLDGVITACMTATEHLDQATIVATDAELAVSSLVRRLQLLEEETQRVNERLDEVVSKLTVVEASGEENERARKI